MRLGASTLQLIRVVLPKLQTPLTDGFMGDVDPAFKEQLLHIAIAQGEAVVEPDAMANDLTGEAVLFVALGVSGWRHVGCLSSDWLGSRGGMAVGIMSWAGEDGQQLAIYGPARAVKGLSSGQTRIGTDAGIYPTSV
jgi:hypothetical protein